MNKVSRRTVLKSLALAAALPPTRLSIESSEADRLIKYLETLAREDGGYGWDGQEHSHLTPTFFVIGTYRLLKQPPPRQEKLVQFVRTHHPSTLKKLEQERRIFEWQQVQALTWLGADTSELRPRILSWTQPLAYLKQYERHGYPLFSSEVGVILSRALLGLPDLPEPFVSYLSSRRRGNGSFNNTPASDGSDGHVMSTWWGLQALETLYRAQELRQHTVEWLRSCQMKSGGFTYAPNPAFGAVDDVAYTWAACRALKLLKAQPAEVGLAAQYLLSLRNEDGGFGDRPGWASSPMATYYAWDALASIGVLRNFPGPVKRAKAPARAIPENLKVFSIQIEAHGQGSPTEAVYLAKSLNIQLWGAKNAKPAWLDRAQGIADEQRVPVKFFVSNEEYGTWFDLPGFGTYSHTSDIMAPAGAEIGASLANQNPVTWAKFRKDRLEHLRKGKGRLIWQFGENEEMVRALLDNSLDGEGYAAISTYHFGNPDFTNTEPFLHRWRGHIPFVALKDAHGPEPWWFSDMTAGFRTLFIAEEPTWEKWLQALERNWVVPVRRDQWTNGKTWMHAPNAEVAQFIRDREQTWRWWNNKSVARPLISIVAVRPEDQFEAARPEKGITIRMRCAWQNTPQGLLKQPLAEFRKLIVDGVEEQAQLFSKRRPNGLLDDHYHYLHMRELKSGVHAAEAWFEDLQLKSELKQRLEFVV